MTARHRVLIIGRGFGGLAATKALRTAQQIFARQALAASVRGGGLDD